MRTVPIFIASSVREFQNERRELSEFLDMLNSVYKKLDVRLEWNRPETASRVMVRGGSQRTFDAYIEESEFFVLLVGRRVGPYTKQEVALALRRFRTAGKPLILPCFLADTSPEAEAYREELRQTEIGEQYIDLYENFGEVKNRVQFELNNYIVNSAPPEDAETALIRAREGIADKIHGYQAEIARLEQEDTTPRTVAEIGLAYAEIARLVQTYHVEPDALLDYMFFLRKQHLHDRAIELGHWLENVYRNDDPGQETWARLKMSLGNSYNESNRHESAEGYYQEALEIRRRLARANPAAFEPYLAHTCNNLGVLLNDTNRIEEAEAYYREALEIYRRLARVNPADIEPDVATTCNNLGILLKNTNRMAEAEAVYREALEIRRRLARANPAAFELDFSGTCNNLGNLLKDTNRKAEAEAYYREALEIRRRLAEANPDAFEPYLAQTCNNLGLLLKDTIRKKEVETFYREALESYRRLARANLVAFEPDLAVICFNMGEFEAKRGERDSAQRYFTEALALFEKFPYHENDAQRCRDGLASL